MVIAITKITMVNSVTIVTDANIKKDYVIAWIPWLRFKILLQFFWDVAIADWDGPHKELSLHVIDDSQ